MFDKDSKFWDVLLVLAVGGMLALMLQINYAHGFVTKDFLTIIATIASLVGGLYLQRML